MSTHRAAPIVFVFAAATAFLSRAPLPAADCPCFTFPAEAEYEVMDPDAASPVLSGLVSADLDGDGDFDLAASTPSGVSVLQNDGDGSFSTRSIPLSFEPVSMSAGDIDGDGDVDFLVLRSSTVSTIQDGVIVLLNQGNAAFEEGWSFDTARKAKSADLADLDGDGDADLIAASSLNTWGEIAVRWNDGVEDIPRVDRYPLPAVGRVTTADIDGDGNFDVAAAGSKEIQLLFGASGGVLGFRALAVRDQSSIVIAGDLDGDGDIDLAVPNYSATPENVAVFLNQGGRELSLEAESIVGRGPTTAGAWDLDGDADVDLAVRSSSGEISLLLNDGRAGFTARGFPAAKSSIVLAGGDFDGDGDIDLATSAAGSVRISLNDGRAWFGPMIKLHQEFTPAALAAADIDGDGDGDLLSANTAPQATITVLRNDGRRAFAPETMHVGNVGEQFAMTSGDFDGDGDIDAASVGLWAVSVVMNQGAGTFDAPVAYPEGTPVTLLLAEDMDGDGDVDIVTGHKVRRNDGKGGFAEEIDSHRPESLSEALSIEVADLDDDGDGDYAIARPFEVAVFLNEGNGSAGKERKIPLGSGPVAVEAADVDQDGDLDLITANRFIEGVDDNVSVLSNAGDASFATARSFATDKNPTDLIAADIDRDGDLDILTLHSIPLPVFGGTIGILCNDGRGTLRQTAQSPNSRFLSRLGGAADLDGDGGTDVAMIDGNGVSVLFGSSALADRCEQPAFHRGDPNGSGSLDVADAIAVLRFLFSDGATPGCLESADADNDGAVRVADAIRILGYLFLGGTAPPAPGPPGAPCGADPDAPGSPGDLGCASYLPCGSP